MDIEGMGPQSVHTLIEKGYIHDMADVFYLDALRDKLLELEGFGEKKVDSLLKSIEAARQRPLAQFITALGIEGVGSTVSASLAAALGSIEAITQATVEQIDAVEGIGPIQAEVIAAWFADPFNQQLLEKMRAAGVEMKPEIKQKASDGLRGMTFVLTGTLPTLSREQATALIESHGGKVIGTVSKKTSYLLMGDSPGSKAEKAVTLKVPIISEADLLQLIENPPQPEA
jgi:DNA ligase (NAD+)